MDFSPEYIKMCEKAEEIQKYEFDDGDFYCERELENTNYIFCIGVEYGGLNKGSDGVWWADTNGYCEGGTTSFKKLIWLPRQDQLQEMISYLWTKDGVEYISLLYGMVNLFNELVTKEAPYHKALYTSFEQLWLAFVMREKFGKVWNKEEWV